MIAPAIEGQFGDVTVPQLKEAIKALGFKDCLEVALVLMLQLGEKLKRLLPTLKMVKRQLHLVVQLL